MSDTQPDGDFGPFVEHLLSRGYSRNECPDHCPHKAAEHAHLHSPGNPASIGLPPVDFILWSDGTSSLHDPARAAVLAPAPLACAPGMHEHAGERPDCPVQRPTEGTVRDWGVRHPDGTVTVGYDGHALGSRTEAEMNVARFDSEMTDDGCSECGAETGKHVPVFRDVPLPPPWQEWKL